MVSHKISLGRERKGTCLFSTWFYKICCSSLSNGEKLLDVLLHSTLLRDSCIMCVYIYLYLCAYALFDFHMLWSVSILLIVFVFAFVFFYFLLIQWLLAVFAFCFFKGMWNRSSFNKFAYSYVCVYLFDSRLCFCIVDWIYWWVVAGGRRWGLVWDRAMKLLKYDSWTIKRNHFKWKFSVLIDLCLAFG